MQAPKPDVSELWIQHQRRNNKTTTTWACIYCTNRRIFSTEPDLWEHAKIEHAEELAGQDGDPEAVRESFAAESAMKKPTKDGSQPRKPNLNEANRAQPEPPPGGQGKRAFDTPGRLPQTRSISELGVGALNIGTPGGSDDVAMQDLSDDGQAADDSLPKKRAALGDGISAGSGSPYRDSSASPPPRRSKARPTSGQYGSTSDPDIVPRDMLDAQSRPHGGKRQLWSPDQEPPLTKASFNDPSNIASVQLQKSRAQQLQSKSRRPFQPPPQIQSPTQNNPTLPPMIQPGQHASIPENYDIILQPETRPISQEQLVAEVKGIYAGLVMVEAKCIEVDNKPATLAQAHQGARLILNTEKLDTDQWQALFALHRALLHEHHDFFFASQHPSASLALRPLVSKFAMPARMWCHGIHGIHIKSLRPNGTLPCTTKVICSTNPWIKIARFLISSRTLLSILTFFSQLKVATGSPIQLSSNEPESPWATTILAGILGAVFLVIIYVDHKLWKDSHTLMFSTIIIAAACVYLGLDDDMSQCQLLGVWTLGAGLNTALLKGRLCRFPKTAGLTALTILTLGICSATGLAYYLPALAGRYSNRLVLAAICALPSTVLASLLWIAIFQKLGVADKLERGVYNAPILAFIRGIFVTFINLIPGLEEFDANRNRPRRNRRRRPRRQHRHMIPEPGRLPLRNPPWPGPVFEDYRHDRDDPNNGNRFPQ